MVKPLDLVGQKYGSWTVVSAASERPWGQMGWVCRCECGTVRVVSGGSLRSRRRPSRSCGCLGRQALRARNFKHGSAGRGRTEYTIWKGINKRCHSEGDAAYKWYGARGIDVCDRWRTSFEAFLADMGPRPSKKHTIDRIDNFGPYSPDNCRWATWREQSRNKRTTVWVEAFGQRRPIADWSEATGIHLGTIRWRLKHGATPEQALTAKFQRRRVESRDHVV